MRAYSPKQCKLAGSPWLRQAVASKLRLNWAPSRSLAGSRAHPEDECYRVSHETIYRSLFVQSAGFLRKSCLVTFDPNARSVEHSVWTLMA